MTVSLDEVAQLITPWAWSDMTDEDFETQRNLDRKSANRIIEAFFT